MREPVRRLTTDTSPQASSSDASQRRFLFVCTHLKTGGAERQWSILLPELHRQGFEVALLTLTAEGDFFPVVEAAVLANALPDMKGSTDVRGFARALAVGNWMPA